MKSKNAQIVCAWCGEVLEDVYLVEENTNAVHETCATLIANLNNKTIKDYEDITHPNNPK